MSLHHVELRKKFAEFWEKNRHKEVPPIPLIPQNDPTTLFTGSGMQQLVPFLLGEPHPLGNRVYNIQPCFRSQDIEEVGDNRHTTFFEMMGNWSLGDYFKKEQLQWFWTFLTKEVGLQKEKLYVTVFAGDEKNELPADNDSIEIWKNIGIAENHIYKYGPEKNWWSRAGVPDKMPKGEPGGPDSEVFYEFTHIPHDKKYGEKCHPNCDCGRFMEIGNSVFMQYKKTDEGFEELPKKNVDFGGGLERILAAENDDPDVFKTDVFSLIVEKIVALTGKPYEGENQPKMRIIADHLKGATFLIATGVRPGNKEHGYVLRRLLRRSAIKMHQLTNGQTSDFSSIADSGVLATYDGVQGIVRNEIKETVVSIIAEEIKKFNLSVSKGLKEIKKIEKVDGKIAFDLYQSFGFPYELTEELFREKGQQIDRKQFVEEFNKHKELSRSASSGKFKGGLADHAEQTIKYHTATHLLHQALFDVLGPDVRQEGSNITVERLRFDFYSPRKPSSDDVLKTEKIINGKIRETLPVEFKIIPKEEALKIGAKSFFREKYPDMVKVYFVGDYSKEFCGGPHVKNTGEIGLVKIFKTEKIGSNLYRIYAK
ncbi:MAG: alanine--tRNA ligase [Patescibacteria group bacterium]